MAAEVIRNTLASAVPSILVVLNNKYRAVLIITNVLAVLKPPITYSGQHQKTNV